MGCNIAKQRQQTDSPTPKPRADHKLESLGPLKRESTIKIEEPTNKIESESNLNPSSAPLDSNKQLGSDIDPNEKNSSLGNLGSRVNTGEFSFKGGINGSAELQDNEKDVSSPIMRLTSDITRHAHSVMRPSPFLLEKRKSEKNFFMKRQSGAIDDPLEKTATFLDSSLQSSKIIENQSFGVPKKIETPGVNQEKVIKIAANSTEELNTILENESAAFVKQNTRESLKVIPEKLGTENSRTEVISHRTETGINEKIASRMGSSEMDNQNSARKITPKSGLGMTINNLQKSVYEKKKSNEIPLVIPESVPRDNTKDRDSTNKDRDSSNKDNTRELRPGPGSDLKFRVNLLDLVRKPEPEYSKKESNSTAEDETESNVVIKKVLPVLEPKPNTMGQNGLPRKNLISFARTDTNGSVASLLLNNNTGSNGTNLNSPTMGDKLSPPSKPSPLHINLMDLHVNKPYFEGMTPITPVDTSFNKSYLDRSILLDVNNISRYDPETISVNYDINHVQYDATQEKYNLLQNLQSNPVRAPNKKFSKSKTAWGQPEINSYTSLAPDNPEPTSMNSLSPMAAATKNPNRYAMSINLLHSPKSPAATPSSRFVQNQKFNYQRTKSQVIETEQLVKTKDKEGQKKINQYTMIKEIGRGGFGKVKLAINDNDNAKVYFAIKVANKRKLKKKLMSKTKSAFTSLQTEIAIMKKMDHPNIVKLFEVIDDQNADKLYLVMEFVKKGAVMSKAYWKNENVLPELEDDSVKEGITKRTLTEEKAKRYFRHLILGLDYLHNYVKVIHRDIKPENLLISDKDVLKLSDFGISHIMEDNGGAELNSGAGTKFFMSPEAWEGKHDGKLNDIWACGGTLYYFFYGKPPFMAATADELKRKVQTEELVFPENPNLNESAKDLISACLAKDFKKRINLDEIMIHPWVTDNGTNPLENEFAAEEFKIMDEDCEKAFTSINFRAIVTISLKMKKNLLNTRRNMERQRTGDMSQIMNLLDK